MLTLVEQTTKRERVPVLQFCQQKSGDDCNPLDLVLRAYLNIRSPVL